MDISGYLTKEASYERVNSISKEVFVEGKFDKIPELMKDLLPLVNIAYYQHIKRLDDRRFSYEDLVQDCVLYLHKDITLRWDKFATVGDYFTYFKNTCRNVMLNFVQGYHSYYSQDEYDVNENYESPMNHKNAFSSVDIELTRKKMETDVIDQMKKLASFRVKHKKAFNYLITNKYVKKEKEEVLRNSLKVLGVGRETANFLFDHLRYLNCLCYNYQREVLIGDMETQLKFEDIFKRFEEPLYGILATNYFETILPEYFAEFGPENTKKFLKIFGGRQITLPSYTDVQEDLLGGIVLSLTDGNKDKLYEISQRYGLKYSKMSKALSRVENVSSK